MPAREVEVILESTNQGDALRVVTCNTKNCSKCRLRFKCWTVKDPVFSKMEWYGHSPEEYTQIHGEAICQ